MKKRIIAATMLAVFVLASCGRITNDEPASEPFEITIMTAAAVGDSVSPDSPVKQRVESLTGTSLDIDFVPSESYPERLNTILASGKLPMIMYIDRNSPNVIQAIRRSEFWDITDYIGEYEHLSKADTELLKEISIDGRVYGLYRSRDRGRFGYAYRRDWLDALGLSEPETVNEFYNMLYAFTYGDPDGNGKDDTYGMTVTTTDISFKNFAVWNGAPNDWGFNKEGRLEPMFLFDEYMQTLKLFRKMAEEGLINKDFVVMDSAVWNDPFLNGESGVILDTCDRAVALDKAMKANGTDAKIGVGGVIDGRARAYLGYSGYFAFPKASVKDEVTLKRLLQFMDDCCDKEVFDLMRYGIDGRHYDLVDGYIVQRTGSDVPRNEINDFNQLLTYIDDSEGTELKSTELQKLVDSVQVNNQKFSISNPAEALISQTQLTKGDELDSIINNACIRYMSGQISDEEYKQEIQRWRDAGGNDVIFEINEEYEKRDR